MQYVAIWEPWVLSFIKWTTYPLHDDILRCCCDYQWGKTLFLHIYSSKLPLLELIILCIPKTTRNMLIFHEPHRIVIISIPFSQCFVDHVERQCHNFQIVDSWNWICNVQYLSGNWTLSLDVIPLQTIVHDHIQCLNWILLIKYAFKNINNNYIT